METYQQVRNCIDTGDQIPPPLPAYRRAGFTKGRNSPSLVILFLPLDRQRGVTCLREAPPAKALCGGQVLRRRQGEDFLKNMFF